MSERLVLVESDGAGLRAALVENRRLAAIEFDRAGKSQCVGSVVRAKIVRTVQGLGTTIELSDRSQMLLERGRGRDSAASGAMVTVQIVRPPRGAKLGTATESITLAGRGVVHLPLEAGITVSRRLDIDPQRRAALELLVSGKAGGWIFRRHVADLDAEDLTSEIATLTGEGETVRGSAVALPAPDALRRLAGDVPAPDRILAAGLAAQRAAERWCHDFAPSLATRIEPTAAGLFDLYDLDDAVAALSEAPVALASGGSLVIEHTEALTAIDVNAGSEPNALTVNLAAATEIARQLRLRHIGGIIVVDFISMARVRDRDRLMEAFRGAVANDPAQTYIVPMSPLGLVEMTRERRGPGLEFDPS